MSYTIVSWHTPDYAACSRRLVESLERHGYGNHIEYEIAPAGKWLANVKLKPQILARALTELDTDIVYLDADAVVHGPLTLFDEWDSAYELGAHYRAERELLGGTLYLRNSERMRDFLDEASEVMARSGRVWQQSAQLVLAQHPDFPLKRLPPEYCCIFDSMRLEHPGIEPVIEHMQHSRQVEH